MHPFANENSLRLSADDIREQLAADETGRICMCGYRLFNVEKNVSTFPKLPFTDGDVYNIQNSTCDIIECTQCGRKMEIAYSIVYSVCVLATNPNREDDV